MHRREAPRPAGILYFSSLAELGHGGQESLLQLIRHLDPVLYRPVAVVSREGSLSRRLRELAVTVEVLPLPRIRPAAIGRMCGCLQTLRRIVARERIAILHSDGPRNTVYAGLLGRWTGRPVVWHARSSEHDPFDRLLARLSSRIILVADALAPRFPAARDRGKAITIHNGVDTRCFAPSAAPAERGAFGLAPSDLVVTVTGKVEPLKGQHLLIEAVGALGERFPVLRALFAGEVVDEAYHRRCLRRAEALGVADRVRFLGHREDVAGLLRASDISASTSLREAFSRAIIEAMASGLPVVAADAGGAREAIIEGETGFVVPPDNPAALGRKLALLAASAELRGRLGRAARQRALECFDIRDNVARTCAVYENLHPAAASSHRRIAAS
jgi:glycosyltransferase involved in cell wall biosynthesis